MTHRLSDLRAFRRSLRLLEREIALSLERETDCCGVTSAQCHLLLESEDNPGASLGELAAALDLDKSTLSRSADGLASAGLLARAVDPANRRKVVIGLTEIGAEKVAAINRLCDDSYGRMFEFIPENKRTQVVESVGLLADALRRKRKTESPACCGFGKEPS
ncbi:MAG: hypothetical protein A2Z99_06540 [Treponema sp. GWB1_62_6]|nr:MAG: hypothetical protein A2Y36_13475 [Treponema sp. GWA1_62_8]OHE68035.1 MAG: hypothetical protein A2Z99_06540 [Treponema sp. GWB1_62_6]